MAKFKLPEPFKTKWIKALRSGRYKQGIGKLYDLEDNSYCCLGVAEKVCRVPSLPLDGISMPSDLPKIIKKAPSLPKTVQDKLAYMNDGIGKFHEHTFKEIADYIEAKL